ncbi:spermidine/putrescine ABC transporter substrate-binding protein [Clostridium sp. chh4-2]|uniref:ABC transporter substrate-binding protein n=1 Tax=Clostridium sp. chh4-2 TaxID=2067550 RepID=UPI000CCE8DE3|nr:ABC transporter substrate-binding protein [Clostridium sp. chh4-2]PNV63880.1 spermidine/putrescine ABC transporter substrate-binding protein [Clostridium sp. chh4-2]
MKKKMLSVILAAAMMASLTACGGSAKEEPTTAAQSATTAADAKDEAATEAGEKAKASEMPSFEGQELKISTFSFNAELLQKNVYDPFMEATGCKLIVEGGKNAERVTKIKETPKNYDVVIIGDAFIADLIDEDLIDTVDSTKLSNLDSLYDIAKAPFGEEYGPAYTFNRLGIVYDKATCPIEINSWEDLWNPELEGSVAIPDITTTSGPLFYYSVAKMANLTPGTDDDAIFKKMEELKPNVMKTYTSANDTITMLNQGEISVAVLLDFSYTAAKSASEDYVWVDPTEGTFSGYNTINIIKGCENKELAQAFIDFYISKEVQLAEALDGVDSPVRTDVELTPEQSANFTYGKEMIDSLLLPDWSVINKNKADWTTRWNELFSVQ